MGISKYRERGSESRASLLERGILYYGIIGILLIAPFYAPLTVLVASHLSHFDFWRIWKELVLVVLVVTLLAYSIRHIRSTTHALKDSIFICSGIFISLIVIIALYDIFARRVAVPAITYGLLIDLRTVGMFALLFLAVRTKGITKKLPWKKIVLYPALLVVLFGFLQVTVLPKDVLGHIGYSKKTITAYQTVDNKPDFVRIESTLRGPNPLGAYLVLILSSIAVLGIEKGLRLRKRVAYGAFFFMGLVVLFGTYSRSAWIGLLLSLSVIAAVTFKGFIFKHIYKLIILSSVITLLLGTFVYAERHSYVVQNVLFHSSNRSTSKLSSNAQRTSALESGIQDIARHPFGTGIGSAGPASLRNTKGTPRISENFFLQIGQEAGLIGILVFIVIHALLLKRLYDYSLDPLALALLGSLVGLIFINLVSHAWADDTLAYIWWGLAGLALAPDIMELRHNKHVSFTKKAKTRS
ncbi:MAG: hypothetical protein NVS3B23_01990 [Candidatus Saccharimonadales bacterium]